MKRECLFRAPDFFPERKSWFLMRNSFDTRFHSFLLNTNANQQRQLYANTFLLHAQQTVSTGKDLVCTLMAECCGSPYPAQIVLADSEYHEGTVINYTTIGRRGQSLLGCYCGLSDRHGLLESPSYAVELVQATPRE